MNFGGRYWLGAPRQQVWAALNDTGILAQTIPGCKHIEFISEDRLEISLEVNLGIARPVFGGELFLSNVTVAESYTLSGRGRGLVLGHAEGSADIVLDDDGEGTLLVFVAKGGASEGLIRLGRKLLGDRAQKVIDGFFSRFSAAVGCDMRVLPMPD